MCKQCDDLEEQLKESQKQHKELVYDPEFGDDKECLCGHRYYRHFDTYDEMKAIGCKYCDCFTWKDPMGDENDQVVNMDHE